MVSATISRLFFFGGRYVSLLLVARLLGESAAGFLLSVAAVEFFRIVFDYGLENGILARFHQQKTAEAKAFSHSKGYFRLIATLMGQCVTSGVVVLLCLKTDVPITVPLVASLQFTCLMGFGYFQAHVQTGASQGMAALIRPLAFALLVQGALLILAYHETVPIWLCGIFFEAITLIICAVVARQYGRGVLEATAEHGASLPIFKLAALRRVFQRIAPLGNVALVGVAYTRVDALAVSLVASGALLTQYLVYQRLASAPLMFFSTIASVSIAKFSGRVFGAEDLSEGIAPIRKHAYMAALVSGVALAVCSPVIASFFSIKGMNLTLLGLQCLVLTLQISNGFHAAFLIALHESSRLWVIARNNTVLAALIMPLAAWRLQAVGIALALCVVEAFCAAQYFRLFHENRFIKRDHAK